MGVCIPRHSTSHKIISSSSSSLPLPSSPFPSPNPLSNPQENETNIKSEDSKHSLLKQKSSKPQSSHFSPPSSPRLSQTKIIHIFGSHESGKTSFVIRVCENKFDSFYIPSISKEITTNQCVLNMCKCNIQYIVDQYENFNKNEIKEYDYIFILVDLTSECSLNEAKGFVDVLDRNGCLDRRKVYVIGNKSEMMKKEVNEEVKDYCKGREMEFFSISVKTNQGIPALLRKIQSYIPE